MCAFSFAFTLVVSLLQDLFVDDALRRFNFYRWLNKLPYVDIDRTRQQSAQACALMMARSYNRGSPDFVDSPDPHTDQTGFKCATGVRRRGAGPGRLSLTAPAL